MDFDDLFEDMGMAANASKDLRSRFMEPPFSVLDTKSGPWQDRRNAWKALGMRSEVGRDVKTYTGAAASIDYYRVREGTRTSTQEIPISIFDPALCELLYSWFAPEGGTILDPFAGGSVRGIVASKMGRKYTGIDIRQEQIDSNREQAEAIVPECPPHWIVGDSSVVVPSLKGPFDAVFSCPPYADLEVYSKLPGDISNMSYPQFLSAYRKIIKDSCALLVSGGYAVFVVGEVRGKDGGYLGFVPDTIRAFMDAGLLFYNEAILLNSIALASMWAAGNMKSGKLAKVHQNVLVFKKP